MTSDHLATALQTVVRVNDTKLFASLELSKSRWLVTVSAPGSEKLSKHVVIGGDGGALLNLLGRLRASAERRGGMAVQVVVIQEAGLDGFWLHRLLEANEIESHVVDPASIAVDRRHRRAKTDVIDGEMLLRTLMAWARGERRVCSMVRPPSPDEEDRRRLTRERGTGSPAHAGIDLPLSSKYPSSLGLPRTRGDRPGKLGVCPCVQRAPPHTRGSTLDRAVADQRIAGSPVHAGIDPLPVCLMRPRPGLE